MSQCFVGEIRLFAFGRVPGNWLACDGSLVSIPLYQTLYALIGTTYGGDGASTFAVPDLRGRLPVHQGQGTGLSPYVLGQTTGTEQVLLTAQQLARHQHLFQSTTAQATSDTPSATSLPGSATLSPYATNLTGASAVALSPATTTPTPAGGTLPHDNMMPTLTLSYCIACNGDFPPPP